MDKAFVEKYINDKIVKGENLVTVSFFELRIKNNLSDEDTQEFLKLAKAHLERASYKVYLSGEYTYKDVKRTVQSNELLVAVKDEHRY